jgi:formiminoglutamase
MLTPISQSLLFSKNDPSDPRMGDLSKRMLSSDPTAEYIESSFDWALLGYPDDEGIALNGGRPGAAQGPDQIRSSFYKMTPSLFVRSMFGVADLGNIQGPTLNDRHAIARAQAGRCYSANKKLISLGGGHDYAYADVGAFLDTYAKQNPLVINFDAHLDVRPLDRGPTSGTPFFRVLNEFHGQFDFVELGIQPQCNSQNHLLWAQNHGAHIIFLEEIWQKGLFESLEPFFLKSRPTFLSLDIDAFTSSEAPGCSQSWASGLQTGETLQCFAQLQNRMNLRGFGIYEVSPPLDTDNRTSKLAALLIHHLLSLQV